MTETTSACAAVIGAALLLATGHGIAPGTATVLAAAPDTVEVGDEAPATSNDLRAPRAHNSPELAVDPTDERVVALAHRLDDPEFSCGLQLSGDGGESWGPGEPVAALPDGVDHCYAPQVAFDADGTLYYLFIGLSGEGNTPEGVWMTASNDQGRSFARPWQVLEPFNYQVRLAVDPRTAEPGRLHLVWLTLGDEPTLGGLPVAHNPIMSAHSDDGGRTFSEPVEVSGGGQRRLVAPAVAVGDSGEVHVAYYDLGDDVRDYQGLDGPVWPEPWAVEITSSRDGGRSFTDPVVVDDQVQPPARVALIFTMPPPSIAADRDGHVYAAWHDARNGQWDVVTVSSDDEGRSWQDPVVLEEGDSQQLLPQLATAPDGRVEVVFFDRVDEAGGESQRVAYAASRDHGRSFSQRKVLTSEASDPRTGPQFHLPVAQGEVELGTGLALHAGDTAALAAWPDTRFAVPGTAQQDLYTNVVSREADDPSTGSLPGRALLALALSAAAAVLVAGWRRRRIVAAGALLLLLTMVVGCQPDRPRATAPPAQPATVDVGLEDYEFDLPESLPSGRVVFDVTNHGDEPHELVLLRLPDEVDGLGDLLASPTPKALPPTFVLPPREPGQSGRFAVDLQPGRYGLICFEEDAGGRQHHERGMVAELGVGR